MSGDFSPELGLSGQEGKEADRGPDL